MTNNFPYRVTMLLFLGVASVTFLAAAPMPDYTVTPNAPSFNTPETIMGITDFTITNNLILTPLTVLGYLPAVEFSFGDRTDKFGANPLGIVRPYVIPPLGAQVVPVQIIPDFEADDPKDPIGGLWSLQLFPDVRLGQNLFFPNRLPLANGINNSLEVQITDVASTPEPGTSGLAVTGLLLIVAGRWKHERD